MLTERDRKALADIERRLVMKDPELARLMERGTSLLGSARRGKPAVPQPALRPVGWVLACVLWIVLPVAGLGYAAAMMGSAQLAVAAAFVVPLGMLTVVAVTCARSRRRAARTRPRTRSGNR